MSSPSPSPAEKSPCSSGWTSEEDARLRTAVAERGQSRKTIKWQSIARQFPNRTSQECRKRWYYHSSQPLRRGPWSREEDTKLCLGVRQFGTRWIKVAELVGTRNGDQCYKRWTDSLDPQIDKSPWTAKEDSVLLESVQTMGRNWKEIVSAKLPYRTGLAAKNRYSLLQRQIQSGQLTASNRSDDLDDALPPTPTSPHSPSTSENGMSDVSAHTETPYDFHDPNSTVLEPCEDVMIDLDPLEGYWDLNPDFNNNNEQAEFFDKTGLSATDSLSMFEFQKYTASLSSPQDWHSVNTLFLDGNNNAMLDWEQCPEQQIQELSVIPQGQFGLPTRDVIFKATCSEGHAEFVMEEMAKVANGLTLGGRVKNFSFSAE